MEKVPSRLTQGKSQEVLRTVWPHPSSSSPLSFPYKMVWQVENLFSGEKLTSGVAPKAQPFPSHSKSFLGKCHFLTVHCFQKSKSQRVGHNCLWNVFILARKARLFYSQKLFWLIYYRSQLLSPPTP